MLFQVLAYILYYIYAHSTNNFSQRFKYYQTCKLNDIERERDADYYFIYYVLNMGIKEQISTH